MKKNYNRRKIHEANQAAKEKRKRGGQPGNTNALSHGLYSHRFKGSETYDLDHTPDQSLANEFVMIRIVMYRALKMCDDIEDPRLMVRLLKGVNDCTSNLKGLIKLQKTLGWNPSVNRLGEPLPPEIAGLLSPYSDE